MASIRNIKNSPYFIATFSLPDGRRTSRSTKTGDPALAQRLANEWQTASDQARQGLLAEAQCRAVLNDILHTIGVPPLESETVEGFLRRWVAGKGDGGTAERYGATVENFLECVAIKRRMPLQVIDFRDVEKFREARAEVAPKTLLVDLRTLSAAFTLARKLGLILCNPVEHALALHPVDGGSMKREVFTTEQVKRLVETAAGDWQTMVLLGYFTAARLSDCANLLWTNVDLEVGIINYEPRKTSAKQVVVPLHPELLVYLRELRASHPDWVYLCPSLAGVPTCGGNGLSTQFLRLMDKAGIDALQEDGKGMRRFRSLTFHSLRHSFVSALAGSGVSQEIRMALAGHSSRAAHNGYTHLQLAGLRAAVEKLPALEVAPPAETRLLLAPA